MFGDEMSLSTQVQRRVSQNPKNKSGRTLNSTPSMHLNGNVLNAIRLRCWLVHLAYCGKRNLQLQNHGLREPSPNEFQKGLLPRSGEKNHRVSCDALTTSRVFRFGDYLLCFEKLRLAILLDMHRGNDDAKLPKQFTSRMKMHEQLLTLVRTHSGV